MSCSIKTGKYYAAACVAMIMISLAAFTSLCIGSGSGGDRILPAGQFVFIDHHVHMEGVQLEGKSRGLMIDFPTYSFDREGRKLSGLVNFAVNDSLMVVYGDGSSLGGAMGGGAATMLSGAYTLPYSQSGLTITSVNENGSVTIEYNNETIRLSPGENWTRITSEIRAESGYGGSQSRMNVTTMDWIVNYGLLNKTDIVLNNR